MKDVLILAYKHHDWRKGGIVMMVFLMDLSFSPSLSLPYSPLFSLSLFLQSFILLFLLTFLSSFFHLFLLLLSFPSLPPSLSPSLSPSLPPSLPPSLSLFTPMYFNLLSFPLFSLSQGANGLVQVHETRQRFLEGTLHPVNLLMCPYQCVTNLPVPKAHTCETLDHSSLTIT